MGLLVGLPLKLFSILFAAVRLAWPVLLILLAVWLVRRVRGTGGQRTPRQEKEKGPSFDGPVYTVDYKEVDEEE